MAVDPAAGGGDIGGSVQAVEADGEVAQRGHEKTKGGIFRAVSDALTWARCGSSRTVKTSAFLGGVVGGCGLDEPQLY